MKDELNQGVDTLDNLEEGTGEINAGLEGEDYTPEDETGEGEPITGQGEAGQSVKKQPYTPDELADLLANDKTVDTERLTLEGQALMRSFMKGYTKKFEAVAADRRALQEERARLTAPQPKPGSPMEAAFVEYMKDPVRVINEINTEIAKLEEVDAYADNYKQARREIAALNAAKDELQTRRTEHIANTSRMQEAIAEIRKDILTAVPDYETKRVALQNFAIEKFGFEQKELAVLLNPMNTGKTMVKLLKVINHLYDAANPTENRPTPQKLAGAGSGGREASRTTSTGTAEAQLTKLFKKATETGDWIPYLMAKDRSDAKRNKG